jgi:hypothetical protein
MRRPARDDDVHRLLAPCRSGVVEAPLEPLVRSLGLGGGTAQHAPIVRTLVRLVDFGLASIGGSTYGIRTTFPPLPA